MVLAGGGLVSSGESLVMSSIGSSMVSGFGDRGTMNMLGFTRAESRTGGVGAATVTFDLSMNVVSYKSLTYVVLTPVPTQRSEKLVRRANVSLKGILGQLLR